MGIVQQVADRLIALRPPRARGTRRGLANLRGAARHYGRAEANAAVGRRHRTVPWNRESVGLEPTQAPLETASTSC
jgi:hypothetical protein